MIFFIFKVLLVISSAVTTILSFVLMVSPNAFKNIEKFLQQEFGSPGQATVLEGEVDFVNAWVIRNRFFFGPLFTALAALNTWNAFFF